MNIKGLLLGSAAALLAVSGARAADAVEVVAEPEPMEYVRICDTYGAKFYYIPGTETCLRVGGFVRYQVSFGNDWRFGEFGGEDSDYGWQKRAIGAVILDARTETELGTLRSFAEIRIVNDAGSEGAQLEQAFISLGGLTIGHASNAFDFDLSGEQDLLGDGIFNVVQYTFTSDSGFSATISVDDDSDVISGAGAFEDADGDGGADFVPNVSANVQYASGPISLGVYGAYDNDTEEFAVKGLAAYSFSDNSVLSVGGYWQSGATYVLGGTNAIPLTASEFYRSDIGLAGEWSLQGQYWHRFNEKIAASIAGVYISNVGFADEVFVDGQDDLDFWRVGTTIDYTIVPDFNIKTSVNYNQFTGDLADAIDNTVDGDDNFGDGYVNGFIRFQRNF